MMAKRNLQRRKLGPRRSMSQERPSLRWDSRCVGVAPCQRLNSRAHATLLRPLYAISLTWFSTTCYIYFAHRSCRSSPTLRFSANECLNPARPLSSCDIMPCFACKRSLSLEGAA